MVLAPVSCNKPPTILGLSCRYAPFLLFRLYLQCRYSKFACEYSKLQLETMVALEQAWLSSDTDLGYSEWLSSQSMSSGPRQGHILVYSDQVAQQEIALAVRLGKKSKQVMAL